MNKINNRIRIFLISLVLGLWCLTSYAKNNDSQLRNSFLNWQKTYQTLNKDEQKKQLISLTNYTLYPYAQYQYLKKNIDDVSSKEVNEFSERYSDSPLSSSLMQSFIASLTKQKKWNEIIVLKIDKSVSSQCRYQYALLQTGQKKKALQPITDIWLSGSDLPSACNPIFDEWNKAGDRTANIILQRIELVLKKNNIKLAKYLAGQLPDSHKTLKKNLLTLFDNPKTLADFAKNVSPNLFSKTIVLTIFPRLVNKDTDLAIKLAPELVKRYKLSSNEEAVLLRSIAVNYFKDSATDKEAKWRDKYIEKNRDVILIERSIRTALRKNDMDSLEHWLEILPSSDKQKDEWRYWQAMILSKKKKNKEADAILKDLVKQRGFYAMYSAQKLKQPFTFDFNYPVTEGISAKEEPAFLKKKYDSLPVIKRIAELRIIGMQAEANAEWRNFLYSNIEQRKYNEIARYAFLRNWGEHSVQATIAGKLWDNWQERFPLVHKELYQEFIKDKSIEPSYALAITRQESALDATVTSPVGARGLMQLMPATAKDTAKKITNSNYSYVEQLYDPKTNIQLGTQYLNYVYQLFGNNRILASAAYNAGPHRVNRWLQDSADDIDAIAFIESIPFTETRNYVKSVLVYDYIYKTILKKNPNAILNESELKQTYHQ